jgi:uncharacterized oxidoreductase
MPTFTTHDLTDFATDLFCAAGAPDDIARAVATSLVETNLTGHDSHGIIQIIKYIGKIRSGQLIPTARPSVEKREQGTATINGGEGFGQITAQFGAQLTCELAAENGIACVALSRVNHIGRLGEYAETVAQHGLIGLIITSGSMIAGQVAPYGGGERRFGTNPMAWGIPTGDGQPSLISDFATSAYAAGKVSLAISKGEALPAGIIIDRDGNPATDPLALGMGGALLPFGTYKGYGLSLVIEIVASLLCGFAPASSAEFQFGNPTLMMAISIEQFTTKERFERLVQELLENVKVTKPAPGFDEVLLPGELEQRTYAERSQNGIPVPDATWADLSKLADEHNVQIPSSL